MNSTWRFPGNNYTADSGIETADMQTFMKEPISSLARELVQNSIDARKGKEPAVIEFKTFRVNKNKIPGVQDIEKEIDYCIEYNKGKKDYQTLLDMKKSISKNELECLRISDFNTKGLEGVDKDDDSPFYYLTKGTGLSSKSGTMGGSKGIGKFASFVTSSINTVFYSTLNIDNQEGSIGICKLCSRRIENSDEKTQGLGYYAIDKKNSPELSQRHIDNFKRNESGTDVYIIGFKKKNNWKAEAITKVLDSFMCAIYFGNLELIIEGTTINKDTLKDIVNDDSLIVKKDRNNILSQYTLLSDESHIKEEIEIENYGTLILYIKSYKKEEYDLATKKCVMVRYPYMKIITFPISQIPCSALCIIQNDILNETLRKIENPQHTDWEFERIDDPKERRKIKELVGSIKDKVRKTVAKYLQIADVQEAEIEGADDFLPLNDDDSNKNKENGEESSTIIAENKNYQRSNAGNKTDEEEEFIAPDLGEIDSENSENEATTSEGTNKGAKGTVHPQDQEIGYSSGEDLVMAKKQLSGQKYNVLAPNIKEGEYIICFTSIYEEQDCDLEFNYLDDSAQKYIPNIHRCLINGVEHGVLNNRITGINLKNGEKYKIVLSTDLIEYYSCEVKMYANKK